MAIVDHRGTPQWEEIQGLLVEATFNGYIRGLKDYKEGDVSLDNIAEEVSELNNQLKEHYYE